MVLISRTFFVCLLLSSSVVFAQGILQFTPEKPRPGDTITVSYTPEKSGTVGISTYLCKGKASLYEEIDLLPEESAGSYGYSIPTDSSTKLIFFSISVGKEIDSKKEEGFWIPFYVDSIPVKESNGLR